MTNGDQNVTNVFVRNVQGHVLEGGAVVNGQKVLFFYNKREDKFRSASLGKNDAHLFGLAGKHNWMYLICGSIAHHIKNGDVVYKC